jgi:outer membrane protein OmpA-like peptidoglycan-associated protein
MKLQRFSAGVFSTFFFGTFGFVPIHQAQTLRPPMTIATDQSWEVSGSQTKFGEYPLSAENVASATSTLPGGTYKAVAAAHTEHSKIIPGSIPIWRNRRADKKSEAYQFRKNVRLGADPIQKVTLEVNCDDVARVYINQRLASVEKRDGKLKDGYDDWFFFRSVSGFMYDRIYTYDVTDYFFTNVQNTILAEVNSLAFDGSHAYFSARIVFEFAKKPVPPVVEKRKTPIKPKVTPQTPATSPTVAKPSDSERSIFEAGGNLNMETLRVGSILELGQVFFKADDYRLDAASYQTLGALVMVMKQYPGLKIEIGGHTNLRPNDRFAAELSTNRANAVRRYLTDNGIAEHRVSSKGYGKSQPRVNALSKDADRVNQRVEVKVLEK